VDKKKIKNLKKKKKIKKKKKLIKINKITNINFYIKKFNLLDMDFKNN